jgi:hypothetical protein
VSYERSLALMDAVYVLLTIAMFMLFASLVRGTDRL